MPEQQYARGLWGRFDVQEDPWTTPNGMEDNLRRLDDHLGLYTLQPPLPPGGIFTGSQDGDGQIYTDGTYAVRNAGEVRHYDARKGLRAVLANGTESWLNTGAGWEQYSVLDTGPATALAEAARDAAEAARDAALIQPGMYPDEPTGRAAVANGQAFKVQSNDPLIAAYEYRRIDATQSELVATYPSARAVVEVKDLNIATRMTLHLGGMRIYTGSDTTVPILSDVNWKMLMGWDRIKDRLVFDGLLTEENMPPAIRKQLGEYRMARYIGPGPIFPILTDASLRVLIGFNADTNRIIWEGQEAAAGAGDSISVRKPLDAALRPIATAVNHLLFYGQSLSVGAQGLPVLSTTQPYANITFAGGPRASAGNYSAFKPLVEDALVAPDGSANRGETPCSGAAAWASTLGALHGHMPADHVILASAAGHGGYRIDQLNKGTAWYNGTFLAHINGAKALQPNYALHAFAWVQGENDAVTGTQTPYATYRAALAQLQADIELDGKAISGQISPVFCLSYQISYAARTWPDQALAQLDLAQKSDRFFLTTPCYHLPFASDQVHLSAVGYKWLGAYFGRAYKELVLDGVEPRWLNPVSATRRGNVIRVRFDVPVLPLVLDTTSLAPTTDHGFRVLDGASTAAISSISVSGSDVLINLAAPPAGALTVRYGLDYLGDGLAITGGASGNLRDSEPSSILIAGTERPLYNVCPHFRLPVVNLGE